MPKMFPIMIEVEEIAPGPVLRRLNDMPGIAKLHLDLGHGGQGLGAKRLERHAAAQRSGRNKEQIAVKLLIQAPKHVTEISAALGGPKSRAYGVVHALRKKGLTEAADCQGMHKLTNSALAQLNDGGRLTLPAPAVKHGPNGRAPGSGNIVLRAALDAGPVSPNDLRSHMASKGMSPKSDSGVLGVDILDAMMRLDSPRRRSVISLARALVTADAGA